MSQTASRAYSPSATILNATVTNLRRHMPFDQMDVAHIERLAASLTLNYFAKGATILSPVYGVVDCLWIVERGVVGGVSGYVIDDPLFSLNDGEMFPIGAAMSRRASVCTYKADTDIFCYVLPMAAFEHAMDVSRPFRHFATRRLAHLLEASRRQMQANVDLSSTQTLASPLKNLLRRAAITVTPDTPIGEVLALMKRERIGSVVIVDKQHEANAVGIFTERDVLDRVALPQINQTLPISNVMTASPFSLPAHAPLFDAAKAMATHRFRHVIVTEDGALCGVVSERDLFTEQRLSLGQVAKSIERAMNVAALASAAQDVRQMAHTLVTRGVAAQQLTQFVTTMNDAIVERALHLARDESAPPNVAWCWLGLGSEGRMEQTLSTDQDNALIFSMAPMAETTLSIDVIRRQLLDYAGAVNAILDSVGFPLCLGDIMAKNPRWCLSDAEWRDTFATWMRVVSPDALLNAAIFFDFRSLAGEATLAQDLRSWLNQSITAHPLLLRQLAANALQTKPPLGLLRDFADTDDDYPGTIDLKKFAARPFIDAARIFALSHGLTVTNTADRLRQAAPLMRLSEEEIGAYIDAFHFVQLLRLRNLLGQDNPNRVSLNALNELDRRILKEALRQARKLQSRLEMDFLR
jgi:CBS domain-containing protein